MSGTSLKTVVRDKILGDVIEVKDSRNLGKTEWRVLVVDRFTRRIISDSTQMHELSARGITLVEALESKRSPMPTFEAIYLITPSQASLDYLMEDFKSTKEAKYRSARIFFTQACPQNLFKYLSQSYVVPHMKALMEVDVAYLPYERQVFSLESPDVLQLYYKDCNEGSRAASLDNLAEQLATVCSTLDEIPSVRYRSDCPTNKVLADLVQKKLDALRVDHPKLGEGPEKAKSQLLILDRGFDVTSMLLHELTYQAMVYDLLEIENHMYKFTADSEVEKEIRFDEQDALWKEIQHQHIAEVTQNVPIKYKTFREKNGLDTQDALSMRGLSEMIKKMPQYQKEMEQFSNHIRVAGDCMNVYNQYVDKLCEVEQDLAMGTDVNGATIRNVTHQNITPILLEPTINTKDKIRIILLYILAKQGMPEETLNKLIAHAQIPAEEAVIIHNMAKLGVPITANDNNDKTRKTYKKKPDAYDMSRWTPLLKDIIKAATEDRLDNKLFPFVKEKKSSPTNKIYGGWLTKDTPSSPASMRKSTVKKSRIICFIAGGLGYSEMRAAYQLTEEKEKWQVIVGGSEIITPQKFLDNVKNIC